MVVNGTHLLLSNLAAKSPTRLSAFFLLATLLSQPEYHCAYLPSSHILARLLVCSHVILLLVSLSQLHCVYSPK